MRGFSSGTLGKKLGVTIVSAKETSSLVSRDAATPERTSHGSPGIDTRTLLRWMKMPEFEDSYREARRLAFGQSIARLQQASSAAVSTLLKIMVDTNAPASTRVRAADCVLSRSAAAVEIEDVEVRVAALEVAAEESKEDRSHQ